MLRSECLIRGWTCVQIITQNTLAGVRSYCYAIRPHSTHHGIHDSCLRFPRQPTCPRYHAIHKSRIQCQAIKNITFLCLMTQLTCLRRASMNSGRRRSEWGAMSWLFCGWLATDERYTPRKSSDAFIRAWTTRQTAYQKITKALVC